LEEKVYQYENERLTVSWNLKQCIHSEKCWRGLPQAFNPNEKPWIQLEDLPTDNIITQIKKCPSGALGYKLKGEEKMDDKRNDAEITIIKKGPMMFSGKVKITNHDGSEVEKAKAAFCRCGASSNKPFCDGSHKGVDFDD